MNGNRLHTLGELRDAALARKSVSLKIGDARMILPAAFVQNMQGFRLYFAFLSGIYIYEKRKRCDQDEQLSNRIKGKKS